MHILHVNYNFLKFNEQFRNLMLKTFSWASIYKKLWHTKMESLYMSEYFFIYKSNVNQARC